MVKNDFDIDIKVKCLEERVTQAQLAEMVGTSAPYITLFTMQADKQEGRHREQGVRRDARKAGLRYPDYLCKKRCLESSLIIL